MNSQPNSADHIDICACGAHPDDVEMGVGGILLKMKKRGFRTGIVDLTRGEMGTRGTPEIRAKEAARASQLLQVDVRENLDLGDTLLAVTRERILALANIIRKLRPSVLLAPYWIDYHPDHATAGLLMQQAFFHVRLAKLKLDFPPHYPKRIYYYPCHQPVIPHLVEDITEEFNQKMEALKAYQSQISLEADSQHLQRSIGITDYAFHVESRSRYFGSLINVRYGEAFLVDRPLQLNMVTNLHSIID